MSDTYSEHYQIGMDRIYQCYSMCKNIEQTGGNADIDLFTEQQGGGRSIDAAMKYAQMIFNEDTRYQLIMVIRSILRTTTGAGATVATFGSGGDVAVSSVFAIESSYRFMKGIGDVINEIIASKDLFNQVFALDTSKKIPLISRLNLNDGFTSFEGRFIEILDDYISRVGTARLDRVMETIDSTIDRITTVVSDWIACLFPDTAGLAGEASKMTLDYIARHGYSLIYNMTSFLPDTMQQMVTNNYALEKFVKDSLIFLSNFLKNLEPDKIAMIIETIGGKLADNVSGSIKKGVVKYGSKLASKVSETALSLYSVNNKLASKFSILPQAQEMLSYIIDHLLIPNVGVGVDLFNQLFPIFLIFTIFIEKYKTIAGK